MIERRGAELYIGGVAAIELAERFATPLYVLDGEVLRARVRTLREEFLLPWRKTRAAYAAKALLCRGVCQFMQREGLDLDVVSGGEVELALLSGFPAERIEFNGNNKLPAEIDLAVSSGVERFIVDSRQEINHITTSCRRYNKKAKLLFRVNPGVVSDTHDYLDTGRRDSKFGFSPEDPLLIGEIVKASSDANLSFHGLHMHIGSQIFSNRPYLEGLHQLLCLADRLRRDKNLALHELNLGGGFGIRYRDEEEKSFSYYLQPLMEQIISWAVKNQQEMPVVAIEPGRSLIGPAGVTLYRAGGSREFGEGRRLLSLDGGMSDNIRPALYGAQYAAVAASRADEAHDRLFTLAGKCCEAGDILVKDAWLPDLSEGDLLALLATGAYGYSMASRYNLLPVPALLYCEGGTARVLVERERIAEIAKTQRDLT